MKNLKKHFQTFMLVLMAVSGMTMQYLLVLTSHILLRVKAPDMPRPFRTPGGAGTSGVALALALCAFVACFLVNPRVIVGFGSAYLALLAYFALYSRHRLVVDAPEEKN